MAQLARSFLAANSDAPMRAARTTIFFMGGQRSGPAPGDDRPASSRPAQPASAKTATARPRQFRVLGRFVIRTLPINRSAAAGRCLGTWWAPPPSKRVGRAIPVRRVRFPSTSALSPEVASALPHRGTEAFEDPRTVTGMVSVSPSTPT